MSDEPRYCAVCAIELFAGDNRCCPDCCGDYDDVVETDEWDEPVGSCDNCGTNLYDDDADDLCSQCEWFAAQNMNPRGDGQ